MIRLSIRKTIDSRLIQILTRGLGIDFQLEDDFFVGNLFGRFSVDGDYTEVKVFQTHIDVSDETFYRIVRTNSLLHVLAGVLRSLRRAIATRCVEYCLRESSYTKQLVLLLKENNCEAFLVGGAVRNSLIRPKAALRDIDVSISNNDRKTESVLDSNYRYTVNRHGSRRYIVNSEGKTLDFFYPNAVAGEFQSVLNMLKNAEVSTSEIGVDLENGMSTGSWAVVRDLSRGIVRLNERRWAFDFGSHNDYEHGVFCLRIYRLLSQNEVELANPEVLSPWIDMIDLVGHEKALDYCNNKDEAAVFLRSMLE